MKETTTTAYKAGDSPVNPIIQTCVASTPKTRRIKRALTHEFDNHTQIDTKENHEPENHKQKRRMLFAPMDFQHFSIDALIDSGALVNCMPESEFQKLKNMSPNNILQEADPPPFKLQVANGDIESPTKKIQVQFEIGDWTFKKILSWRTRSQVLS